MLQEHWTFGDRHCACSDTDATRMLLTRRLWSPMAAMGALVGICSKPVSILSEHAGSCLGLRQLAISSNSHGVLEWQINEWRADWFKNQTVFLTSQLHAHCFSSFFYVSFPLFLLFSFFFFFYIGSPHHGTAADRLI